MLWSSLAAIAQTPSGADWPTASARKSGLSEAKVRAMDAAIRSPEFRKIGSVLVARHGKLAYEGYFDGDAATLRDTRSATKTITNVLVYPSPCPPRTARKSLSFRSRPATACGKSPPTAASGRVGAAMARNSFVDLRNKLCVVSIAEKGASIEVSQSVPLFTFKPTPRTFRQGMIEFDGVWLF